MPRRGLAADQSVIFIQFSEILVDGTDASIVTDLLQFPKDTGTVEQIRFAPPLKDLVFVDVDL